MKHALPALIAVFPLLVSPIAAAQQPTQAPSGEYVLDKTHASVQWKVKHQGISWYVARFTGVDVALTFNPADVSKSKISATIDPKSVETDYTKTRPSGNTTDFNKELAEGENFFNAGKFPKITFVSTKIEKTGADTGKATGNLTFLGVTKPVTLDVTYVGNRPDPRTQKHKVGFIATTKITRSDFGLDFNKFAASDEVQIEINGEFIQK